MADCKFCETELHEGNMCKQHCECDNEKCVCQTDHCTMCCPNDEKEEYEEFDEEE